MDWMKHISHVDINDQLAELNPAGRVVPSWIVIYEKDWCFPGYHTMAWNVLNDLMTDQQECVIWTDFEES